MTDLERRLSAPSDPRGRLISIFVGAVLLPSVGLSVLSFHSVPKVAEGIRMTQFKQAEKILYYVEKDLEMASRARALEAARAIGPERLLEGRRPVIHRALLEAGLGDAMFETLRLEASSPRVASAALGRGADDLVILKEALKDFEPGPGNDGEDSVPLALRDSTVAGVVRFRYTCSYAHGDLLREFFESDFVNPDQTWVIRVTEPEGEILYENAPTPDDRFEVKRVMSSPSFKGLKLHMRYKDRSIAKDVRRWEVTKYALIGLIDIMLGAGLFLVYFNVKREMHLSRLKSDFVANVSHELKTPLALIRLFAETLELGRVHGEGKARQYYRIINKESHRLTQLINNILDFSRIEAGRKEYKFAPTDVGQVVHEVLEAYRFHIEQQGFALEVSVAEDVPELEVDKEALGQAVLNLLNNAIKYSGDEKYIRLDLRREADRVLLSVTDRGVGVAKADHKKIFEKFYRSENSLVHETKGSGLGLALVRHIMEAHGGTVELESTPGKGSTFTLVLPVEKHTP
jgi:signal transduction histidine kinase